MSGVYPSRSQALFSYHRILEEIVQEESRTSTQENRAKRVNNVRNYIRSLLI